MRKKVIEEAVKIEPIRQARFYGTPGIEPVGYTVAAILKLCVSVANPPKNYAPEAVIRWTGRTPAHSMCLYRYDRSR
jgi:hypothetical protein